MKLANSSDREKVLREQLSSLESIHARVDSTIAVKNSEISSWEARFHELRMNDSGGDLDTANKIIERKSLGNTIAL